MFLKGIKINNFRSIQKAETTFDSGLNILIGRNGVGKSNLLKYINQNVNVHRLASWVRNVRYPNVDFEFTIVDTDAENNIRELEIAFKRSRSFVNEELAITNSIKLKKIINGHLIIDNKAIIISNDANDRSARIQELRRDTAEFRFFAQSYLTFKLPNSITWLDVPAKFAIDSNLDFTSEHEWSEFSFLFRFDDVLELAIMGYLNAENEFSSLSEVDLEKIRSLFFGKFYALESEIQLIEHLKRNSPIQDIRIGENINIFSADGKILIENLFLEFKLNGSWVPWSYLSDGTQRLFYIITECLNCDNGSLILIEEPELGIHPHQLFLLMQFLREQSELKQIIISTHSPIVLDILSHNELDKITIVKLSSNGTVFHKLNNIEKEKAEDYMNNVGELSYYWLHSDLEDE